jgi:4-hydroxybenzoate polyprenyltransferase
VTTREPRVPLWRHPYVVHLRVAFNLTLSPLYLWGVFLAGGSARELDTLLGWIALHLFLYPGTTAFNSLYDRDEGPIGGLERPPAVDRGLLPWSLAVQAAGLPLAWWVGPPFLVVYVLLFLVAAAYSHPSVRLKARPAAALTAVALGQGGLGFLAGWWSAAPPPNLVAALADLARADLLLGAAIAASTLTGLYIVSQSYQTAADRARGDRTLPVLLGPTRALRLAALTTALGATALTFVVASRAGGATALAIALPAALGVAWWWRWAGSFDEAAVAANFRTAMRLTYGGGSALTVLLVALLLMR